jgi:hypothetical protein
MVILVAAPPIFRSDEEQKNGPAIDVLSVYLPFSVGKELKKSLFPSDQAVARNQG